MLMDFGLAAATTNGETEGPSAVSSWHPPRVRAVPWQVAASGFPATTH